MQNQAEVALKKKNHFPYGSVSLSNYIYTIISDYSECMKISQALLNQLGKFFIKQMSDV